MSDEQIQPDRFEALRLEVERLRLRLDEARYENERTRTFLERWRTDVEPLHEGAERSREMAFGFAQTAIRSMFILNGGALVAVPAFAELVGTAFQENPTAFLPSGLGFVTGLILIAITTVLAYTSMDADAESIRQGQEVVKINLNRAENPKSYTKQEEGRQSEAKVARQKFNRRSVKLRTWALWLGVGSMGAFVFGAAFAAVVLSASSTNN